MHNFGNPIPEAERPRLFEPYTRAPGSGSQKGWGIGLTLVKGLAEAMGGQVGLRSSEREGTTFSIELPKQA